MTTPVDPFVAMEARRVEQLAEYGTYAAAQQIFVGSSLAYDVGHPIPASNVNSDDLSVVTLRHYCPPDLPGQPKCEVPNNKILQWSGPGAAVKVDQSADKHAPAKSTPAKASAPTKES